MSKNELNKNEPSIVNKVQTEADKIWDEVRGLPIQMFALPNQVVEQHCTPVQVDPNRLYVLIRSSATLPSLEAAIGNKFTVELADKFVIIARASQAPQVSMPKK